MKKIVFIGAGNVATNLSISLQSVGFTILQIYSRTINCAKILAEKLDTFFTDDLKEINQTADLYLFCVSDDAISEVLNEMELRNKFFVHTAGSVDINVFKEYTQNFGVFYPLQSFRKNFILDFKDIPICVEANNFENEQKLAELANKISVNVNVINSVQREQIHLAAVFANNFTNFMLSCAFKLSEAQNIDFKIYKPVINNTVNRAFEQNPINNQTGPAIRGDEETMEKHLKMLKKEKKLKKIYKFISKKIGQINKELGIRN